MPSPFLFRKWAAITAVGAVLERRVWNITAKAANFANLFVILIGRPGVGKSKAINAVRDLIRATKVESVYDTACHLAPVDVTKASLYDYLAQTKIRRSGPDPVDDALGVQQEAHYHSAFLAVSELSDLIRDHDTQLLGALHGLFDCLPYIEEERRYRKDQPIKILRPQISLLGGTTPAYISRTFPPSAWDEGFMARSILIYSSEAVEPKLFDEDHETEENALLAAELVEDLREIGKLKGRMVFTEDAKKAVLAWQKAGRIPAPTHTRLEHYKTRRMIHAMKLSIIASAERSGNMMITVEDFQTALAWMHEAELEMPNIFLEMNGKSDGQTITELYHFVQQHYTSALNAGQPELRRALRKGMLVNFLRNKIPAYQIEKVIETACDADLLEKVATLTGEVRFRPKAKSKPN